MYRCYTSRCLCCAVVSVAVYILAQSRCGEDKHQVTQGCLHRECTEVCCAPSHAKGDFLQRVCHTHHRTCLGRTLLRPSVSSVWLSTFATRVLFHLHIVIHILVWSSVTWVLWKLIAHIRKCIACLQCHQVCLQGIAVLPSQVLSWYRQHRKCSDSEYNIFWC